MVKYKKTIFLLIFIAIYSKSQEIIIKNQTGYTLELKIYLDSNNCPADFKLRLDNKQIIKLHDPLVNNIKEISYYQSGQVKSYSGMGTENTIFKNKLPKNNNLLITLPPAGWTSFAEPQTSQIILKKADSINSNIENYLNKINKKNIAIKYSDIRKEFNITAEKNIYSLMPSISYLANTITSNTQSNKDLIFLYYLSILYKEIIKNTDLRELVKFKDCLKSLSNNQDYQNNIDKLLKVFSTISLSQLKAQIK